jgi:hypothetical protein
MSWRGCSHLDEVRETLRQGHWPEACAPELRAHARDCHRCAEEILLSQHFQVVRAETAKATPVGAPSLLWWRAQVQRRNSALERAGQPVVAAQLFALLIALVVLGGMVAVHFQSLMAHVQFVPGQQIQSLAAMLGDWGAIPLAVALGVVAMLGGVVVYLTAQRQ